MKTNSVVLFLRIEYSRQNKVFEATVIRFKSNNLLCCRAAGLHPAAPAQFPGKPITNIFCSNHIK